MYPDAEATESLQWLLVTSLSILICTVQLYLLAAAAWESAPMGKCSVWEKMQRAFVERLNIC